MTTDQYLKEPKDLNHEITITLNGANIRVSDIWDQYRVNIGRGGYDVACYIGDGLYIWPCGITMDDDHDNTFHFCKCRLCNRIRKLIK